MKILFDKEEGSFYQKLIQHAKIAKEVLFVGLGPTFQMWNPLAYDKKKMETIKIAGKKISTPDLNQS